VGFGVLCIDGVLLLVLIVDYQLSNILNLSKLVYKYNQPFTNNIINQSIHLSNPPTSTSFFIIT